MNHPITVLYLIDTCISPPTSNLKGGAEKQLYLLASSLNSKLFKPIVVQLIPEDSLPIKYGKIGVGEVYHFPTEKFYNLQGLRQLGRLCSLAKRNKVDIIHTFFEKSEVMGWLISRLSGVPIWVTSRRDLGFNRKKIYHRIFRFTSRNCKKCVANCLAVKAQVIRQEHVNEEKIEVVYNGLDPSSYHTAKYDGLIRKELGINKDTSLVGMIANFNFEIKGHRYFMEAAKKILEKVPDVTFLLVGDGPLRKRYEKIAQEMNMKEKIYFLGKRNDILSIISSLNISVSSSMSEGLSNVILESMAAGKPVVATNVGGSKEMVSDGITGYLVPPADSEALANAVISLLQNPDKAKATGNAGKKVSEEKFTAEAMVKSYENLYVSLLQKYRG
jgi:glycosyltransferase involved in cell wall biosynthesis